MLALSAQAATVLAVPSSIVDDCSSDVSASLGAFLASAPNESDIEFPVNGCYRVETEIDISNKSGWTIRGNGTVLRRTQPTPAALQYPHANAFLRFINMSTSTVEGLNIVGVNTVSDVPYLRPSYGAYDPRYPFDHGIALEGATNVVVRDSKVDAVFGDGVYISGGDQYTQADSSNVRIQNVTIDRNGRQGISVSRSSGVVLDEIDIQHSRRSGIDLEPDSANEVISNVEIKNSRINSWLLAFAAGGPGAVNGISIHDNTVTASGVPFVYDVSTVGTARSNWQIVNNTVTATLGSPQPAMAFANTSNVRVAGNYVAVATTQSRLEVGLTNNTINAQVSCNQFPGALTAPVTTDSTSSFAADRNSLGSVAPTCKNAATTIAIPTSPTSSGTTSVAAGSGSTAVSTATTPATNTTRASVGAIPLPTAAGTASASREQQIQAPSATHSSHRATRPTSARPSASSKGPAGPISSLSAGAALAGGPRAPATGMEPPADSVSTSVDQDTPAWYSWAHSLPVLIGLLASTALILALSLAGARRKATARASAIARRHRHLASVGSVRTDIVPRHRRNSRPIVGK